MPAPLGLDALLSLAHWRERREHGEHARAGVVAGAGEGPEGDPLAPGRDGAAPARGDRLGEDE